MKSFDLKDNQIVNQVKHLNRHMPKDKVIVSSVIETRFGEKELSTPKAGVKKPDSFTDSDSKLMQLKLTITQDDLVRPVSSASRSGGDKSQGSI